MKKFQLRTIVWDINDKVMQDTIQEMPIDDKVRLDMEIKRRVLERTDLDEIINKNKPQICIPKTGNILLIHIQRRRFLICIGRLIISSVSGIWWKHDQKM